MPLTGAPRRVARRLLAGLDGALRRFGRRVAPVDEFCPLEPLLYRRLRRSGSRFFFIQVGANDGTLADPIYEFVTRNRVSGVVVEPLADVFARLEAAYRAFPGVRPVNVAIHASARSVTLHRVAPQFEAGLPDWARGIASVNPDHHKLGGVPSSAITTEEVSCLTLTELLDRFAVRELDLLQIDTEGYDAEIIHSIDFGRIRPKIIRFEHGLCSGIMTPAVLEGCVRRLAGEGYYVVMEPYDVTCYLPDEV